MAAGGHFVKNWLSHVLSPNFENFVSVLYRPVQNGKLQVPFDFGCDPIKNGHSAGFRSLVVTDFCGEKKIISETVRDRAKRTKICDL